MKTILSRRGRSWIVPSNSSIPEKGLYSALTTGLIRLQSLTANPRVRGPRRMSLELILCPAVYRESMPPRNPLEIVGNRTVREVVFNRPKSTWIPVEISMLEQVVREKFRRCGSRIFLDLSWPLIPFPYDIFGDYDEIFCYRIFLEISKTNVCVNNIISLIEGKLNWKSKSMISKPIFVKVNFVSISIKSQTNYKKKIELMGKVKKKWGSKLVYEN